LGAIPFILKKSYTHFVVFIYLKGDREKMTTKAEVYDVQPIRSKEILEDMKWSLKKWCGQRDYILFLIGINTGLRVGDLVKLKVKQIKSKKKITVKEGKTKKPRVIQLSNIFDEIQAYIRLLEGTEWLFPSRQGGSHITTTQAYRQLVKAAKMVDIEDGIGTHTMRKTFGYWFYKQTKDIAKLQEILNHSKPEITKRYIGITQEEIEDSLNDFVL
jgi:integrase